MPVGLRCLCRLPGQTTRACADDQFRNQSHGPLLTIAELAGGPDRHGQPPVAPHTERARTPSLIPLLSFGFSEVPLDTPVAGSKNFSMQYFLCILTLCLTQALWLSSTVLTFALKSGCGVDSLSTIDEPAEGSILEAEIDETEFIGHAADFGMQFHRPRFLHLALSLSPVPSRPIDARGCRPPPPLA